MESPSLPAKNSTTAVLAYCPPPARASSRTAISTSSSMAPFRHSPLNPARLSSAPLSLFPERRNTPATTIPVR